MLKKLIVSETPTVIRSVTEEINLTTSIDELVSAFDTTRFLHWHPTPEIAIVSGSTYSAIQACERHNGTVLDACACSCSIDINTGTYTMAIAISDGQGHSTEEKENVATAQIARYNCEQFINSPERVSANRYNEIDTESRNAYFHYHNQNIPFSYDPFNSPSATLAGVILTHRADHHDWQLHISAAGDSITTIINGQTGAVIFSSAAQMIERAKQVWTPTGVQQLNGDTSLVQTESLTVHEGDWVIQMTDGFWGELSGTTKTQKTDEHHGTYTEERLEQLSLDSPIHCMTSATEAAQSIVYTALKHSINKRQLYLNLLTDHEYQATSIPQFSSRQQDENYTMQCWMDDNQCSEALKIKIRAVQALQSHDGAYLRGNVDQIPASQQIDYWQRMTFGDCSTLQVMRIPNYTQCILREWFESDPERWAAIANNSVTPTHHSSPGLLDADINAVLFQNCVASETGLRSNEIDRAKRSPLAHLHGLTTQKLADTLDLVDFPYIRAIVLAGTTPTEQAQRWQCFAEPIAAYETHHRAQHNSRLFKKSHNPVNAMRKAVLNHVLDSIRTLDGTQEETLQEALSWPFFTEREKRRINQELHPSICSIT